MTDQANGADGRSYFKLFRNGNFSLLWSGSLASQLGDHLNLMALTALIFSMSTGQTKGLEFSKILLLASAPVLIVGPISGVYADRLNRKHMMIASDILRAILVAAIPFFALSMIPVYIIVFLVFTINRFYLSARSAAIPQVARSDQLMAANSLLNVAMMATIVLGPWGGGALVERFGYDVGFWADAATYLVSALLVTFMTLKTLEQVRVERETAQSILERVREDWSAQPTHGHGPAWIAEEAAKLGREIAAPIEEEVEVIGSAYHRLVADLKDGLARMRGSKLVVYSTVSFSAIMFVAGFVLVVFPVLVKNEFGMGTAELGMIFSVAGVGMLIGSLVVGRFFHDAPRRAIIAASFLLAGVDLLVFSQAGTIPSLGVGVFLLGLFLAPAMVTCDTVLQETMPGETVGKAFGFRDMVSKAAFGVAGILSGVVVDVVGPRQLLVLISVGCVGYSAFSMLFQTDTSDLNLLNAYPLMRLGSSIAARFPRRVSYRAAILLSGIAYLLLRQKRRCGQENMSRVIGKPAGSRAVKSLVRRVFRSYGLYYADFFGLNGRRRGNMTDMVRIEGLENLKAALGRGRGAIFVTAHIGSWDMGGAALAATEGLPELSAVVEPVATQTSDFAVTEMREKRGIKVIPLGKPMGIWRALRRNEIVFVLAERLVGAEGVDVVFFGEKTLLPKGAAYWALKCGAPIVPGFCIRQPDGTYVGYIERPIDPEPSEDFEADLRAHTQRVADVVERYIARYPEQWCMLQRVWRTA